MERALKAVRLTIYYESSTNDLGTSVDRPGDERYLEERTELILVLNGRLGVHESTLVAESAVTPNEDVVRDRLPEDLDLEDVGDDLLRLAIDVGVHECDVVVAGDDVPEGGETLFDALEGDGGREGVSEVLEFLIRGRRWHEESVTVSCRVECG
jgi:hypothetical protein